MCTRERTESETKFTSKLLADRVFLSQSQRAQRLEYFTIAIQQIYLASSNVPFSIYLGVDIYTQ